jgi:prepilin-type N-terminal cleavage/methylation domain-containing protein
MGGFSLIELVVTTAIFLVVTSVVLINYPKFQNTSSLVLLSQEVALSIREAQVFGLSSAQESSAGVVGHGVYFASGDATSFILFGDQNGDKKYDGTLACTGECLERFSLKQGFAISKVQIDGEDVPEAHIVFTRPDPEPTIRSDVSSGHDAAITLRGPDGTGKRIEVTATGQIAVYNE